MGYVRLYTETTSMNSYYYEELSGEIFLFENKRGGNGLCMGTIAGIFLLLLVIGILAVVDKKVKKSFIEKYQYIEEHTIGISMEKEEILKLHTLGKWNRRALGFIVLIGLLVFLMGVFLTIKTTHLTGVFLVFLGGIIGIIFFHYGEFMEAAKVKKYLQTD